MTSLLSKIKLKLICFATFILMTSANAQKRERIVRVIARKTHNERVDVKIVEVITRYVPYTKEQRRRMVNSQLGMPKGFGYSFNIPPEKRKVYFAVYTLHGNKFCWALDENYRTIWKNQISL